MKKKSTKMMLKKNLPTILVAIGVFSAIVAVQIKNSNDYYDESINRALAIASTDVRINGLLPIVEDYSVEVRVLQSGEIRALAEISPEIYDDLPRKEIFQLDYTFQDRGIIAFVDLDQGKVIKTVLKTPQN